MSLPLTWLSMSLAACLNMSQQRCMSQLRCFAEACTGLKA